MAIVVALAEPLWLWNATGLLLLGYLSAMTIMWCRRKLFALVPQPSLIELCRQLNVPQQRTETRLPADAVISRAHQRAIAAQDTYVACLTIFVAELALGFIVLCLAATGLFADVGFREDWFAPSEVLTLLFAGVAYFWALAIVPYWVRARAKAEILRRSRYLDALFGLSARHEAGTDVALAAVGTTRSTKRVVRELDSLWTKQRQIILAGSAGDLINFDSVAETFFYRRGVKQCGWFLKSEAIIKFSEKLRRYTLISIYLAAIILTIFRYAHELHHPPSLTSASLSFILMLLVGISGAMASFHLGRASRSLRYRYAQQRRQIENWVKAAKTDFLEHPAADRQKITGHIVAFEDLMNHELLDWISITTGNVIELSL